MNICIGEVIIKELGVYCFTKSLALVWSSEIYEAISCSLNYWAVHKLTLLILELSVLLSSLSADSSSTLSDFPTMPYWLSVSCKTTILVIPTVAKNAMNRLKLEFIISFWAVKILGIQFSDRSFSPRVSSSWLSPKLNMNVSNFVIPLRTTLTMTLGF